ncbi:MAG: ABC transporter ATP-binding protein [Candidatus Rokubacteria bacterium]|nr:ABC transporter ATP-binding protein [Candidatus Rokubacteria bacterium]
MTPLLEIRDLAVHFAADEGRVEAVDGISLTVRRGEILGLVGESGSGKSVTALAVLRLIRPPGRIVRGSIRFDGRELLDLSEEAMRHVRGSQIAMIFQSPRTALNPVLPVGRQIARLFELHRGCSGHEAWQRTLEILRLVGIPEPERRASQYAHQLSGGMCQRVMIAMAVATEPRLLLADEPTTGLDVSIAAQILDLLRELGRRTGASMVLITHDLGVVAGVCDRVAVMHAGQLVECSDVHGLFKHPAHPYTRALVRSIPRVDREVTMEPIPGAVPSVLEPPPGCRYADRCPWVIDRCREVKPELLPLEHDHEVACHAVEPSNVVPARS